jgi:hypothetical protein
MHTRSDWASDRKPRSDSRNSRKAPRIRTVGPRSRGCGSFCGDVPAELRFPRFRLDPAVAGGFIAVLRPGSALDLGRTLAMVMTSNEDGDQLSDVYAVSSRAGIGSSMNQAAGSELRTGCYIYVD